MFRFNFSSITEPPPVSFLLAIRMVVAARKRTSTTLNKQQQREREREWH